MRRAPAAPPRVPPARSVEDELDELVARYRHLRAEHARAHAGSRARRRLEHRLRKVEGRFERLLGRVVVDESRRAAWRARLHGDGPRPEGETPSPAAAPAGTESGPPTFELDVEGGRGGRIGRLLERKLARVARRSSRPVVHARAVLSADGNPSLERPALARVTLELADGSRVRAHASAPTATEAIDRVEARLSRRLRELEERTEAARHEPVPLERHEFFPRPPEERRLLRRKTFASAPMTADEAAWEMELLDHDFFLFTEVGSGEDMLVYRRAEGGVGLQGAGAEPAAAMLVGGAIDRLDATSEPFVFFVDADDRRGRVLYRRYDGHYGLIEPAQSTSTAL